MKPGLLIGPLLAAFRGEDTEEGAVGALFLAEALIVLREANTAKKRR